MQQRNKTHHSASVIPRIDHVGESQDTTDTSADIGTIVAIAVGMMQLSNQLQLKAATTDILAPDVDHTTSMAGQHQFTLQPFILHPLVEDAGQDAIVSRLADWLINQHYAIEGK